MEPIALTKRNVSSTALSTPCTSGASGASGLSSRTSSVTDSSCSRAPASVADSSCSRAPANLADSLASGELSVGTIVRPDWVPDATRLGDDLFADGYLKLKAIVRANPQMHALLRDRGLYRRKFYETLAFKALKHENQVFGVRLQDLRVLIADLAGKTGEKKMQQRNFRWSKNEGTNCPEVLQHLAEAGVSYANYDIGVLQRWVESGDY